MTEAEWLECTDPDKILGVLRVNKENRSRSGRRRLRLFGCGCGHRVVRLMSERGRKWLDLGEQCADGLLDRVQRRQLETQDIGAVDGQRTDHQADLAAWFTLGPNVMIASEAAARSAAGAIGIEAWQQGADYRTTEATERKEQVALLRDIFGNPFRPATINPAWLAWNDGTVKKIAQAIYNERAFDRMPILADALEEAGCTNANILAHCRQPGEHVRGCWVVDAILDKE